MNLQENIQRIKEMMGIIKEENNPHNNLITESIEGKRCWYYKKMAERRFEVDPGNIPNLYEGAYQVQRFLNYIGYNISRDYTFGNETATALGTWAYGKSKGINTVDKLWQQMKNDGWDVGETTGYGGKMVKAVADMIVQICKSLAKTCKVDQQTLFDMEFKMLQPYETKCRDDLDKQYERAIQYWKNYLNSEGFKKRIKNKEPNIDNKDIFGKIYDTVFNLYWGVDSYSLDTIINLYKQKLNSIKGWKFAKEINATNTKMESSNPISVNEDFYCIPKFDKNTGKITASEENVSESYSSFVHEISHILDQDKLNDIENIKKAYPLTTDHYSDKKSETKIPIKRVIPAESKKELISNGVDYKSLSDWANQEGWENSYWCDSKEKISNLNSFRSFLVEKGDIKIGGDITVPIFTKYLKKYLDKSDESIMETDFQQVIVCWVQNNFTPQLSVFISELNSLAKEDGNKEKDYKDPRNINKGTTT
jgi:hypothetical protein